MMEVNGGSMTNTKVVLDGVKYTNVTFTNCTIIFSGADTGKDMGLIGCKFINCQWRFEGAAGHTINFLNSLTKAMGKPGEQLLKNLFQTLN
ncbi:hypothetical protein ACUBYH_000672 [Enterobacter hormaechei]|uniref:hypothetical protein n=1 Tax=Enterobacter hormaechei TaxID=158836 RepID=UPI0007956B7D|nr:hypothetical protein [Enterobacter hormaechei]DAI68345.1 MAG TPA: hypothetical protein [Caudoviricetes sp.]HCJ7630345.1 hypothetical protein [Enterobacter hormaechei subsp. xiangfangensis]HED1498632.1 hypothetical protein [Enterobacter hormaechei subsp. hoffmannii]MDS1984893.1 hypothetical protein [Enterobacter hormaechei]CZZ85152.1 Uncharacterised protein [Enterobacter hormaechei]